MARNFAEEERRELLDRLEGWATRLRQDQSLPWIGMGFIKDLDLAIEHLGGKVYSSEDLNRDLAKLTPAPAPVFDL